MGREGKGEAEVAGQVRSQNTLTCMYSHQPNFLREGGGAGWINIRYYGPVISQDVVMFLWIRSVIIQLKLYLLGMVAVFVLLCGWREIGTCISTQEVCDLSTKKKKKKFLFGTVYSMLK